MDLDITSYLLGKNSSGGGTTINNQDITVTENGEYTADSGYTGLGTVTVNVPAPSGTINIVANGTYDVTDKASAVVNVAGVPSSFADLRTAGATLQNSFLTIPSDRTTYTNDNITIYSPSSTLKNYVIVQKSDGYRVYWSTGFFKRQMFSSDPNDCVLYCKDFMTPTNLVNNDIFGIRIIDYSTYAYSSTFATIESLVTAMQTNGGVSYNYWSSYNYITYTGTVDTGVLYSNAVISDVNYNTNTNTSIVGILSYNETIVAQS